MNGPGASHDAHVLPDETLALSLRDVARATGLGKSALYDAVAGGRLAARKCGRRTLVLKRDLDAFLDALPRLAS
jgi:excisionase family DNA binding protein